MVTIIKNKLEFDDVMICPSPSNVNSRKEVDLNSTLVCPHSGTVISGINIIASNMDGVGTFNVGKELNKMNMFTAINKHYDFNDISYFFQSRDGVYPTEHYADRSFYTLGLTNDDFFKFNAVKEYLISPLKLILLDVANGYTDNVLSMVKLLRLENQNSFIMVGNVATPDAVEDLIITGASCVKVGIGSGSVCTTRDVTGIGYPQLSAVMECAEAAHMLGGYVCSDGGCKTPGDVAKAFVAGADFVMLGGMFAGSREGAVKIVTDDHGDKWVSFYGMSSQQAQEMYSDGVPIYGTAEGTEKLVSYKGNISEIANKILGGLRSTCTYIDAPTRESMYDNATFIIKGNH